MRALGVSVGSGAAVIAVAGVVAAVLLGCGDSAVGPSTQEFSDERKALAAKVERNKPAKAKKVVAAKAAPAGDPQKPTFGAVDQAFSYDPRGRRDPFRSFEWDRLAEEQTDARGPLEQFDVAQLALVAVVWKTGSARALVQDPSGQGYIVAQGTKIGKNEGRVISIDDNLVVVKETYVDYLGQETTKDIEMRIRLSEGG